MSGAVRQLKRRPAKAVQRRTVHVLVEEGEYAGWEFTAYADFKARLLHDLQSGDVGRMFAAFDKIVVEHNFPDADDPSIIADSIADVDRSAISDMADRLWDEIRKLPNR